LPLLPSQSSHPMNRDDIDCGHRVFVLPTAVAAAPAVVATIERRRIPSARLRRAPSRQCRGSAPSHRRNPPPPLPQSPPTPPLTRYQSES
jgi:hypothetical protein